MTPEQYRRVSEAFDDLAPVSPVQRAYLINARFAQEPELKAELESLLAEHDRVDAPVETAAGLDAIQIETPESHAFVLRDGEPTPVLKGAYRLLRAIGEGGMGVVYEAEQAFPKRRVALKSIRNGLTTSTMLRRFRTEIELLARLHHPGIAQLYEAGLADENVPDQAFFVMELVDGEPLHKYARSHPLTTPDKIDLVLKVCDAVQHAHQRGVIHRDLKPGNILVTSAGQPKVLDFGVARSADDLGDATMATRAGQVIGTPSYMSPEQMFGEPIDTRSDVYALGVIAYELLSGSLPFDFTNVSLTEAARILRERTASPLSRTNRSLRGDLDVIISTAMHPDRERRYSSVAAFGDDLRRYLEHRPIAARRDSPLYVASKIARRHWAIVSLAALLLVLVIGFAAYSSAMASKNARLAFESDLARKAAVEESNRNVALSQTLERELSAARIDRGRAEAAAGKLKLAEDTLWAEHLANPTSTQARWALWEMYQRMPCLWTVKVEGGTRSAISEDGSSIAIASTSGSVVLLRGDDGVRWAGIEQLDSAVTSMAFSPDGASLALGFANGRLATLTVQERPELRYLGEGAQLHSQSIASVAFSRDGTRIFTGSRDRKIGVWDTLNRVQIEAWPTEIDTVSLIAVNRDGSMVFAAGPAATSGRALYRKGVMDDTVKIPMAPFDQVRWMAFTPDDASLLVSRSCNDVGVLNLASGQFDIVCRDFASMAYACALSPDGSMLAIGAGQELLVVPAETQKSAGAAVRSLGQQQNAITRIGWTKEGRILTVSDQGEVRCFDRQSDPGVVRLGGYQSWCFSSAWSPDGKWLVLDGGGLQTDLFRSGSFERVASVPRAVRYRERAMSFLQDSQSVLSGGMDGRLRVFDIARSEVTRTLGDRGPEVYTLALLHHERFAVTGHIDGSMRVWNLATGSIERELPKCAKRVDGLALSPDGTMLAGTSLPSGVQLWDAATHEPTGSLETSGSPWGVAFSPDGQTLFATTYAGMLDVFDVKTRTRRASVIAHQRLAPGLACSPDGKLIATGSEDGSIRLWDASTLRQLLTLEPRAATIVHLAFDPTSRYLSAGAEGRSTIVFDLHAMDDAIEGNRAFQESQRSRE